jgi:hypothetical protein
MTLDINGYNDTFKAFVAFAQGRASGDDIARGSFGENGGLAGHEIHAGTTDRLRNWRNWRREDGEQNANNVTRTLFINAVIDMFGGRDRIPESVKKALKSNDYGHGKPLTARRILLVKDAIDANGTMRKKALSCFHAPELRQAALDRGYRETELVRLARAVNFYAAAAGCSEEAALAVVAEPGSDANRLLRYGGRFLSNARNFADGLRLVALFRTWYEDLLAAVAADKEASGGSRHPVHAADDSVTALNASWSTVLPEARLGVERFVFEHLAHDPNANLKATDPEEIFGAEHNIATAFVCQGFGKSAWNTLAQVPHEKRTVLYKSFGLLCVLARNPQQAKVGQGVRHFGTSLNGIVLARLLKHIDRLAELDAQGQLDAETIAATCFPDVALQGPYKTRTLFKALDHIVDQVTDGDDWTAGCRRVAIMQSTGCTAEEAFQANDNEIELPEVPYLSAVQTELDKLHSVENARDQLEGDLVRPFTYAPLANPEQHLLEDRDCNFNVTFPDGERLTTNSTEQGRANARRVVEKIETLCGRVHPRQTANVMLLLSQAGISILRGGLKPHDISSNEHSPVDFTLEQDAATGDITIRYASPAGLPFAFAWTCTVGLNGTVNSTPFQFTDSPPLPAH